MMLSVHAWPAIAVLGGGLPVVVGIAASDWVQILQSAGIAVGSAAAGIGGAFTIYLKAYEGSAKQQADQLRHQVEGNSKEIEALKAANDTLRAENADYRHKLAERDRSIALRDDAIKLRDMAIDTLTRSMTRLGGDTADMAEAFLIQKGDAKTRDNHA